MPLRAKTSGFVVGLSVLTALLAIFIPILTLHLGFYPWKDEEYQILCVFDYQNTPLAALTMYIGHIWTIIVGNDSIMSFRVLAYICNTLSVALPCLYFLKKQKRPFLAAFIFLILQLCISLFGLFSYEWDTTTHLFLTIGCLISVSYLEHPDVKKLLWIGIISAFAIFSRIPNVALVVVVIALVIVSRQSIKGVIKDLLIYTVSCGCFSIVIIFLIWGGFSGFIDAFNPENYITGHNSLTDVLFLQVWSRYPVSLRYFFMWGGVFATVCFINVYDISKKCKYLFLSIITFLIVALWLVIRVTSDDVNSYPIDIFYFSLTLIPAYAIIRHNHDIAKPVYFSLTLLGFALVSYVGSDCGLSKILCIPLMPIIFSRLEDYKSVSMRDFYIIISVCVLVCYIPLRLKNPWSREWINKYDSVYTGIPKLSGIFDSEKRVECRMQVFDWASSEESKGRKILFLGQGRYLYDYLLNHTKDNIDRYPVQRYHDDNSFEGIENYLFENASQFDCLYLGFEFESNMKHKISDKLAEKGFSLYLSGEDYSIWKK